jgi:hypothetical protein
MNYLKLKTSFHVNSSYQTSAANIVVAQLNLAAS